MLLLLSGNGIQREISDVQLRAVRGQTGMDSRGYAGAEVTADGGSAHQHNVGLIFLDHGCQRMRVRLRSVILQLRIVNHDHSVSAVSGQVIHKALHIGSDQNSGHVGSKILRQLFSFADQLVCDTAHHVIYLLRKDKYSLIFF